MIRIERLLDDKKLQNLRQDAGFLDCGLILGNWTIWMRDLDGIWVMGFGNEGWDWLRMACLIRWKFWYLIYCVFFVGGLGYPLAGSRLELGYKTSPVARTFSSRLPPLPLSLLLYSIITRNITFDSYSYYSAIAIAITTSAPRLLLLICPSCSPHSFTTDDTLRTTD